MFIRKKHLTDIEKLFTSILDLLFIYNVKKVQKKDIIIIITIIPAVNLHRNSVKQIKFKYTKSTKYFKIF